MGVDPRKVDPKKVDPSETDPARDDPMSDTFGVQERDQAKTLDVAVGAHLRSTRQ